MSHRSNFRRFSAARIPLAAAAALTLCGSLMTVGTTAWAEESPQPAATEQSTLQPMNGDPKTVTVCASDCNFTSIQAAIDAESTTSGDTISLATSYEHNGTRVTVDKNLTIEGNGVTINGGFDVTGGVTVTVNNMTISGITGESSTNWSTKSSSGPTGEKIVVSVFDAGSKLTGNNFDIDQVGLIDANVVGFNLTNGGNVTLTNSVVTLKGGNVFGFYFQNGTLNFVSASVDNVVFNFTPQRQRSGFNNQNGVIFGAQVSDNNVWPTIEATNYTLNLTSTAGTGVEQRPYKIQAYYDKTVLTETEVLSWVSSNLVEGEQARVYYETWINEYVPPVTNATSNKLYPTIQTAIDDANAGDTINVAAGTYTERVTINKTVSLLGPNASTSPWSFDDTDTVQWGDQRAKIIGTGNSSTQGVITVTSGSSATTIAGFEITAGENSTLRGISGSGMGGFESFTIRNNYIHNTNASGIYLVGSARNNRSANTVVEGNLLEETITDVDMTGVFLWYQIDPRVTSNLVRGYDRGIGFDTPTGTTIAAGNYVENIVKRGMQFAELDPQATIRIQGNSFINTNNGGGQDPEFGSGSLRFYNTAPIEMFTGSVVVQNNIFGPTDDTGTAVVWFNTANLPVSTLDLTLNRFDLTPGSYSLALLGNDDTGVMRATANRWPTTNLDDSMQWVYLGSLSTARLNLNPIILNFENDPQRLGQPGFWPINVQSATPTPTGTNVTQDFTGGTSSVSLDFANVTTGGETTVTSFDDTTPPEPVSGFKLGEPPVYFQIETTAVISGSVELCFTLPDGFDIDNPTVYRNVNGTWSALQTTAPQGEPPEVCATIEGAINPVSRGLQAQAAPATSLILALGAALPPDPTPTPVPVFPPSAPLNVGGTPQDGAVTVTWDAPTSSGSFPVTTYQVVAAPGGAGCLASAPALDCTVSGLTNGSEYTFEVRALNGAGWGPYSAPSAPITPRIPDPRVLPTITVDGERGIVRGRPGIVINGVTTGLQMGAILQPWFRFPGQTSYTQGVSTILVDENGGFTWQRRTGKKIYISIRTPDGSVVSNRLILRR